MPTVHEHIEILKRAQDLDREIYVSEQQLAIDIPEEQTKIKRELEHEKAHLQELDSSLKTLQLKQKEKEGVLAQKEAHIKKLDGQLAQIKTNKEYSALQQEIASIKADNSLLEEEIIKILDEVEAANEALKSEKERLKKIEKEFQDRSAVLSDKEKKIKGGIDGLKKQRDEILQNVIPEIKDQYDRIIRKKQGLAIVKVIGENCGACQLLLRPQVLNELQGGGSLVICENCSRILYYERP